MVRNEKNENSDLRSVLLVEDDALEADYTTRTITEAFPACDVRVLSTESEFLAAFPSIAAHPPSMVITGMMMPWSHPGPDMPGVPPDVIGNPFVAGARCIQRLASDPRTKTVPIILYSALDSSDVVDHVPQLPVNVQYLSKSADTRRLLTLIRHFRQAIQDAKKENPEQAQKYRWIVQKLGQAIAEAIAEDPTFLDQVEWRDLERTLTEVFTALGYEAQVTRAAKDGGKDIILRWNRNGTLITWYVELKHWSQKRVGSGEMRHFAQVLIRDEIEKGLLLSSGGFVTGSYQALSIIEQTRLTLGGKDQIINLCKTYVWAKDGIWTAPETPLGLLHARDATSAT